MALLSGCTILLVDDDPDTAELQRYVLTMHGARVVVAQSADEAMAAAAAEPVDVLVADIAMPSVDGFELLRRIRVLRPSIPAIAVSAFAQRDVRTRAFEAGFLDWLTKPLNPLDLVRVARSACASADALLPAANGT